MAVLLVSGAPALALEPSALLVGLPAAYLLCVERRRHRVRCVLFERIRTIEEGGRGAIERAS
jgi:hypothetical protein